MASCPPGFIFNPETYRCVKYTGRIGRKIQKSPPIAPILTRRYSRNKIPGVGPALRLSQPSVRLSQPSVRFNQPVLRLNTRHATRGLPLYVTRPSQEPILIGRLTRRNVKPEFKHNAKDCGPNMIRNPESGKCIKKDGRIYKYLMRKGLQTPSTRLSSRLPSRAARIPVADKSTMREWIMDNCENIEEPFTGRNLRSLTEDEMGTIIKTTAGTCLRADYLDAHVRRARESDRNVRDPLKSNKQLTLSNMDIMGKQIRRYEPDYRVPQPTRKTRVPVFSSPQLTRKTNVHVSSIPRSTRKTNVSVPSGWKFFIGKDGRSGDDFYSVYYYDSNITEATDDGLFIPPAAVKIDIGLIPAYVSVEESHDSSCTTATLVSRLVSLNKKGRLIRRLGSELVGVIELPHERSHWKTPDGAIQRQFFKQVCSYLRELDA